MCKVGKEVGNQKQGTPTAIHTYSRLKIKGDNVVTTRQFVGKMGKEAGTCLLTVSKWCNAYRICCTLLKSTLISHFFLKDSEKKFN